MCCLEGSEVGTFDLLSREGVFSFFLFFLVLAFDVLLQSRAGEYLEGKGGERAREGWHFSSSPYHMVPRFSRWYLETILHFTCWTWI